MPPRPGSGSGTEIDPQLDNVLRNLNVNLEDELARYRRHRHGRVPPPPPPRRSSSQRQTLDLISVPGAPATDGAPPPTPPPPPPNPFLNQETSEPEDDKELSEVLLDMDAPTVDSEQPIAEGGDESALPVHASDTPTEGYLESSEELLKSLAEDQTEPASVPEPYSPERKDNGLLKLAGLVLVLLAGIGAGFAVTYPAQLQNLRSRIWPATGENADTPTAEEAAAPPAEASPETAAAPETLSDGYKPPGPDLSTREFKELDQIEDLVTLDVDGASGTALPPLSSPAQTPIPTATPTPGQAALPEPATNPGATPAPTAAPSQAAPAPAATGSNFYVITNYTGDASLVKARELVPDAFVRSFEAGARIQLAAFDNRAQAEEQVTFLTQQGAVVELFGPTNE